MYKRQILAQTKQASDLGIDSTPSFLMNDKLLAEHDWAGIQSAITAK